MKDFECGWASMEPVDDGRVLSSRRGPGDDDDDDDDEDRSGGGSVGNIDPDEDEGYDDEDEDEDDEEPLQCAGSGGRSESLAAPQHFVV